MLMLLSSKDQIEASESDSGIIIVRVPYSDDFGSPAMGGAKGRTAKPTHFYLFEMLLQVLACREN